jgi:drug/metabolite transporter (DMT)-like permease
MAACPSPLGGEGYKLLDSGWHAVIEPLACHPMNSHMPKPPTMSASDWLLLVVLSVLWGGSFFFNKVALFELPPITIVCLRVGLGAVLLIVAANAMGLALPRAPSAWAALAGMGFLNAVVPFTLIAWSQTHIASGLASILNATTPLFTVVVAHLATADDKLTRGRVAGLVAGFAGVVVMLGPDLLRQIGADVAAQLAMLVASLFYALSGVYGRRFAGQPPVVVAAGQMTSAALMLLPLMLIVDRPWTLPPPSPAATGSIVALAVFSTALGYLIYFRILARAGATNLLLVTFLIPVSAILLGVGVLGEALEPRQLAGMVVIGLGLAAIDGRPARWVAQALRARNSAA